MDLGCKFIVGSGLQEEPSSLSLFSELGSLYRDFFLHFYFLPQRDGVGRSGWWRVGGMVCVHSAPPLMQSQCFLSLSLELVLRHQPGTLAGCPTPGASRRQAVLPEPAAAGGTSTPPAASLTTDSCCPALRGLSVWGKGSRRDCALPSAPTPEMPLPPHQPPADHAATLH